MECTDQCLEVCGPLVKVNSVFCILFVFFNTQGFLSAKEKKTIIEDRHSLSSHFIENLPDLLARVIIYILFHSCVHSFPMGNLKTCLEVVKSWSLPQGSSCHQVTCAKTQNARLVNAIAWFPFTAKFTTTTQKTKRLFG